MSDEAPEVRPPATRRGSWATLSPLIIIIVLSAVLAAMWAQRSTEEGLEQLRVSLSAVNAQVQAIQAERAAANEARRANDAALAAKLDTITQSMATITAKLEDVRAATENHPRR